MRTAREREIDTTKPKSPRSFSAAGIRLSDIRSIPMDLRHETSSEPEDVIYLFGRDREARRYGAQVFIHAYPLPEGVRLFRSELAFYRQYTKGFLIEGAPFDRSLLLPSASAPTFQRESFQTRDGAYRRRIVHVFTAPKRAVILVFSLNAARFASCVFFRQVCQKLKIGDS